MGWDLGMNGICQRMAWGGIPWDATGLDIPRNAKYHSVSEIVWDIETGLKGV